MPLELLGIDYRARSAVIREDGRLAVLRQASDWEVESVEPDFLDVLRSSGRSMFAAPPTGSNPIFASRNELVQAVSVLIARFAAQLNARNQGRAAG